MPVLHAGNMFEVMMMYIGVCTCMTQATSDLWNLSQPSYCYVCLPQHCNGEPKDDKKRQLIDAANKVLESHALLQ